MGLVRNITKNALALGSVQFISLLSTLLLSIVLARYLGAATYGTYTLAFSLSTLVFFIADFNLGFQLVIEVAPNKEIASKRLTSTILLRGILGVVSLAVTFLVVLLERMPPNVAYAVMIIAISFAFNWIYQAFTSMYTAFEQMHYVLLTVHRRKGVHSYDRHRTSSARIWPGDGGAGRSGRFDHPAVLCIPGMLSLRSKTPEAPEPHRVVQPIEEGSAVRYCGPCHQFSIFGERRPGVHAHRLDGRWLRGRHHSDRYVQCLVQHGDGHGRPSDQSRHRPDTGDLRGCTNHQRR